MSPPLLPLIPAKSTGFTAVILTYDRLDSLYKIIQQVALAPSLTKVLVIWNNQLKAPPPGNILNCITVIFPLFTIITFIFECLGMIGREPGKTCLRTEKCMLYILLCHSAWLVQVVPQFCALHFQSTTVSAVGTLN